MSESLKAAGAAVVVFQRQHHFGCCALARRRTPKITSSIPDARMFLWEFSPITTEGLDEIGFAAAVRPDDARQSRLDEEIRRLDEGLEAGDTKTGEPHAARPPLLRRDARKASSPQNRLDDLLKLVNGHVTRVALTVDEEGRRGIDFEGLHTAVLHRIHRVIKLLVLQAGVELLL